MATKLLNSTFDPRIGGVQAIALDNEHTEHIVFGPFCRHCGTPREYHSPTGRCPARVGPIFPPPACGCHGIKKP